jgi:peptidyl-prolyl cis-trans isomerase D
VELTEEQIQIRMASIAEKQEVRASHILLTLPSSDARERGEEILEELRAGADFAELAKEHSEDPASAVNGGDVGFFGRGAMVPEFENAAFSLEPGEISDLVTTDYGFHIIKVTEVNMVDSRALAESALRQEEGEKLAKNLAAKVAREVETDSNLETAAEQYNLEIQETPFFSLGDVLPDLRVRNDFNRQVFALSQGQTIGPYDQGGTDLVAQLTEIQPSAISEFETIQDQVTEDLKLSLGEDIARERAFAFAQALQEEPNFEEVAAGESLQVTTTDFFKRDASINDELGYAAEILSRAFRMKEDELSPALSVSGKYVVFQLAEKSTVDEEQFEQAKEELLLQITNEKRSSFFSAWVQNVISTLYEENKIQINQPLVDSIAG